MDTNPESFDLADPCFHRVPTDVVARDVVLAAIWHLYVAAAVAGLPTRPDRTFRHTLLGKRCGLAGKNYRAALAQLEDEGLLVRGLNSWRLTKPRGFAAVQEIVDTERSIKIARSLQAA
jgi:hypothetical protein